MKPLTMDDIMDNVGAYVLKIQDLKGPCPTDRRIIHLTKPINHAPSPPPAVQNLSGGELQRVAIVLCLGKPADVYLIDEPSAYLDSEQVRYVAVLMVSPALAGGGMIHRHGVLTNSFFHSPHPSLSVSSTQRIACSKVIKRFIMHSKKTAFVVEHDFIMATYLADRCVLFEGAYCRLIDRPHRLDATHLLCCAHGPTYLYPIHPPTA